MKKINSINTRDNKIITRSPIVTILGHVDHGKTSLLNYMIKEYNKIKESGSITQRINTYNVKTKYGNITFLDTPGHFAFNSTRIRSVKCTDMVILVIATDDGIMPQTIEAINITKDMKIPIIVAINKIDKTKINNEKIVTALSKYNLIPEKWGGDTLFSFISAKTGEGIDTLLDQIKLQAEILDLKAEIDKKAECYIIDNKIDIGKGQVTSLIILNGCLKVGDIIISGNIRGKIKTITNIIKKKIKVAYPSDYVEITGLNGLLEIGEKLYKVNNEKEAKKAILKKVKYINVQKKEYDIKDILLKLNQNKIKKLNLIIKTDIQGSINVLKETLIKLSTDNVKVNIIKAEIGNFNKSDIKLAKITNSNLIGFNIKSNININKLSKNEKIKVNYYNIIYDIIDYIKILINNKNKLKESENILGIAEVKKIFKYEKTKVISGCIVINGKLKQNSNIKIFRQNNIIYKGTIESIKIFKVNVLEVKIGMECGISIKNYNDIQISDYIKAYI